MRYVTTWNVIGAVSKAKSMQYLKTLKDIWHWGISKLSTQVWNHKSSRKITCWTIAGEKNQDCCQAVYVPGWQMKVITKAKIKNTPFSKETEHCSVRYCFVSGFVEGQEKNAAASWLFDLNLGTIKIQVHMLKVVFPPIKRFQVHVAGLKSKNCFSTRRNLSRTFDLMDCSEGCVDVTWLLSHLIILRPIMSPTALQSPVCFCPCFRIRILLQFHDAWKDFLYI